MYQIKIVVYSPSQLQRESLWSAIVYTLFYINKRLSKVLIMKKYTYN